MWLFIFSVLTLSTYQALTFSSAPQIAEASTHYRFVGVVFSKTVWEKTFVSWRRFAVYRPVQRLEVCFITPDDAATLRKADYSKKGVDKYGLKYFYIRAKAELKVRAFTEKKDCYTIQAPWWKWINIGGGGHVS